MGKVEFDGYTYATDDNVFISSIKEGRTEPYTGDLDIVNKYFTMFPHKNRTYIDIGAHIGTTIMPYSKMFDKIIGYEPCSNNFTLLKENIETNGIAPYCTIFPYAIYSIHTRGNILMHNSHNSGCFYFQSSEDGDIESHTLDEDCQTMGLMDSIDFIKIDTEGTELFVLLGAEKTLRRSKPFIQIEYNGLSDKLYNITLEDIYKFFNYLGYIPFHTERKISGNMFFYHPNDSLALIPRYLFCFWFGSSEITSNRNRTQCLYDIQQKSGVNVQFLSNSGIDKFIIPAFPLHPSFQYLSETHKADYMRTYISHFIGGGYTDIKRQECDWNDSYDILIQDDTLFGIGYPEIGPNGVGYHPVAEHWKKLIGNGAYIFRPGTVFTKQWYEDMIKLLDNKHDALVIHPALHPQDCRDNGSEYPIEWNEMLGRIFHRINYLWHPKIKATLIHPQFYNYR